MSILSRAVGVSLTLTVSGCMVMGGNGPQEIDTTPMPALLRAPNPMRGITQTYEQHIQIDSIRTMYRLQLASMGKVTRLNHDDMDNVVRREIVDLRAVLTPEQQVIFDGHVAAALASPPAPATDLDH
jgi:hypothetical protein